MDLSHPWCTYRTTHPSGCFYEGKGRTDLVRTGRYIGSGTRFRLALTYPGFEPATWQTTILATFPTEQLAYDAEARLIPAQELRNPLRLNMVAGGKQGRWQTPANLLRQDKAKAKAQRQLSIKQRAARIKEAK